MKNKILYITCLAAGAISGTGISLMDSTGTWFAVALAMTLIPAGYIAIFLAVNRRLLR